MGIFNFNKNTNKSNFKLPIFYKKFKISFKAYETLKKIVIKNQVSADKLDFVYPQNWKPKIFKNLSSRALTSLYRLSEKFEKNSVGILSQSYMTHKAKKRLSKKAQHLLKRINADDNNRYSHIDVMIKKHKINKILG